MNLISFLRGDNSLTPAQERSREIFFYLIFGVLTTLVNIASFIIFDKIAGTRTIYASVAGIRFDLLDAVNNTVAWMLAVMFAFVTNRAFVFCSKGPFFKEMAGFFASRVVTLVVFEIGTFELCIFLLQNVLGIDKGAVIFSVGSFTCTYKYIVKLLNSFVFVVTGNYVLSKLFVFRGAGSSRKAKPIKTDLSVPEECDKKGGQ